MIALFRYITDWVVEQTNALFQIVLLPLKGVQKTVQGILTQISQRIYAFFQELHSINHYTICQADKSVCQNLSNTMDDVDQFVDGKLNEVYRAVGAISAPIEDLNSTVSRLLVRGALGLTAVLLGLIGAVGLLIVV